MKRLFILPLFVMLTSACMWWTVPQYGGYDDPPPPVEEPVAVAQGACQFDDPACYGTYVALPQSTGPFGLPTLGSGTTPVAVRVYMDFMCPHCADFAADLEVLIATYGDRVRFEYIPMTFVRPPHSEDAAKVGLCASEQGVFWQYQAALFMALRLGDLRADVDTPAWFIDFGTERGLDEGALTACLDSINLLRSLEGASALAGNQGVSATPTILVTFDGGVSWTTYTGAYTYADIVAALDTALE